MQIDPHEQALRMIDKSLVAELSDEEERHLLIHLRECESCRQHQELSGRTVQVLSDFSFEASPAFTARIQESITQRAADLEGNRQRMRNAWWSFAAAVLLTLAGSAVAWEFAPLLFPYFNVDQKQLQLATLLLLFLPSLFASALLPIFGHLSFGCFAKEGLLS
jgi:predicted anti-sigma-YlaC factor YlaD